MEKLKKKTFYTLFSILSMFLITIILFFNIQSYKKEYNGIKNNLTRIKGVIGGNPYKKPNNKDILIEELNNKIIMDYNVYTFILDKNNNIIDKISHNELGFENEVIEQAKKILDINYNNKIKINCLYFSDISYNLKFGEYLIIINISNIKARLLSILLISFIISLLFELVIYYVCKKITKWITNPVEETFDKQKDFIADASHELKTPLAVIIASVDCIEECKENEKWINNIKIESNKMNNLITKLLDLSKSETINNKEIYTINNLSKIIEKRTLVFESLAFENNVEIESKIEKNIMFKCNNIEIDEVISILIDNAIKHSFKKSKIKVKLYKEKNNIIIEVTNKGDNIQPKEYEKIFERFYRNDQSRNRNSNRYGLGLAIAKNIVNNHGGQIKVFSENNNTTFRILFKYKKIF